MSDQRLKTIVIAGDGTAAWMTALCLSRALDAHYDIRVVELRAAGDTACLGEAEMAPAPLRAFHGLLGLSEPEVARFSHALPCFGTQMRGFGLGSDFIQAFGETGTTLHGVEFQHFLTWLQQGEPAVGAEDFNLAATAGRQGRFAGPANDDSIRASYTYGLTLDAAAYAQGLKMAAGRRGLTPIAVTQARIDIDDKGHIRALITDAGEIAGDFFIDATGAEARLLRALPDFDFQPQPQLRARRVSTVSRVAPSAHALNDATATGEGVSLAFNLADRQVVSLFNDPNNLDETSAARFLSAPARSSDFVQGRVTQAWLGNCLALGNAAGVLMPLGISSLHRLQRALVRLLGLFPDLHFYPALRDEYNALTALAYDRQADIVLASEAVQHREGDWPEPLRRKIVQFESRGRIPVVDEETFNAQDWFVYLAGLGLKPQRYDPRIDSLDAGDIRRTLDALRQQVARTADAMPPFRMPQPQMQGARP